MTTSETTETWRSVPSFTGLLVSSLGRIMVERHRKRMPNGGWRIHGGTPTFGVWDKHKRRFVYRLRGRSMRVAVLVCEAFHGKAPADKPYCLHRDERSQNNKPTNLCWGTQKENLTAPGFIAYCHSRTGANNPRVKGRLKRVSEVKTS